MRQRWWPLPVALAALGTLVVVGLTQGWLHGSPVVLPRALQVGSASVAPPRPQPAPVLPPANDPPPADGTVVAPARPVLSEQDGRAAAAPVPVPTGAIGEPVAGQAESGSSIGNTAAVASPSTTTSTGAPRESTTTTTFHWGTTTTTDDVTATAIATAIDR
jgi:hypothetical protein